MATRPKRSGLKPCGWPAGIWGCPPQNAGIGSLPQTARHGYMPDETPQVRVSLPAGKICLSPQWPDNRRRRNTNTGPSRYSSSHCTRPGPAAPGSYHYRHTGYKTDKMPGGLPITHPYPNYLGPVCLPLRRKETNLRDCGDKNSCLIHVPNNPTTAPYNPSATLD